MALNLKDRYRLLKRFVKVFFSDTSQIGLTWKEGTRILSYHVYDDRVTDRYKLHLEYIAQVSAHSKSLDDFNNAINYFVDSSLTGYCAMYKVDKNTLSVTSPKISLREQTKQ